MQTVDNIGSDISGCRHCKCLGVKVLSLPQVKDKGGGIVDSLSGSRVKQATGRCGSTHILGEWLKITLASDKT